MLLFVARHAWAGHYGDPNWPNDALRELTAQGAVRYREMITKLAEHGFAPQHVATSPLTRCVETAWIISEQTLASPQVEQLDALAPGSDMKSMIAWSETHAGEDICWVGHNPDVERMVAYLIGAPRARIRFAKGSIAAIRFESIEELRSGSGELVWHLTAKALGV